LDTAFESKILALLFLRRTSQGFTAAVTCEEVEREVLQDKKKVLPDVRGLGVGMLTGTREAGLSSQPSRTRERCRQAARRLAARGEILITQDGKVVDPSFAKGVLQLTLSS
jgi:Protein of unknown function (DUF3253)